MTDSLGDSAVFARLKRAFGANALYRACTILMQFVTTAFFVRIWGAEAYGFWLVLTAIPLYLTMADLGLASAAANQLCLLASSDQDREAGVLFRQTLGTMVLLASGVALVATAYALLLGGSATLPHFRDWPVKTIILLLVYYVAISLFGEIFTGALRARHRYATALMLNNLFTVIEPIGVIVALALTRSPVAIALCQIVLRACRVLSMALLAKRIAAWDRMLLPLFDLGAMRQLLAPALGFAALPLSRALNNQGIVLVSAYLFGPAAATVISVARTLSRSTSICAETIASAVISELSHAAAASRYDLMLKMARTASQAAFVIGSVAAVALVVLSPSLLHAWVGSRVSVPAMLLIFLVVSEVAISVYRIGFTAVTAANQHFLLGVWAVIQGGLVVALTYALDHVFGISGAGVALALMETLGLLVVLYKLAALARISLPALARDFLFDWSELVTFARTGMIKLKGALAG